MKSNKTAAILRGGGYLLTDNRYPFRLVLTAVSGFL